MSFRERTSIGTPKYNRYFRRIPLVFNKYRPSIESPWGRHFHKKGPVKGPFLWKLCSHGPDENPGAIITPPNSIRHQRARFDQFARSELAAQAQHAVRRTEHMDVRVNPLGDAISIKRDPPRVLFYGNCVPTVRMRTRAQSSLFQIQFDINAPGSTRSPGANWRRRRSMRSEGPSTWMCEPIPLGTPSNK